jgi:Calcineurin-like phosphoesterase
MLAAAVLSAWLQYAADGKPHARALATGACPTAITERGTLPMRVRAAASDAFPDIVCDVEIPAGVRRLRVAGRRLPAPAHDPRTVVVFGDTGCTIGHMFAQSCGDPVQWPFAGIARTVAALHPDLVIHVGDYLYREHACPLLADCKGSPYGDDAAAWNADWFAPAAPLFAAAPLVLIRGNHEECRRSGPGWFRYLEPHATIECADATEPYAIDLGSLRLVAFDSSVANDRSVDAERTFVYRRQFARVNELAGSGGASWFLPHRPPYANADERAALGDALAPFDAVLAGHIHNFTAMNVEGQPPLLINGMGGATLTPYFGPFLAFSVGDLKVAGEIFGTAQFGFGVYTRTGMGWTISLRDPAGIERARCALANRVVRCRPEAAS